MAVTYAHPDLTFLTTKIGCGLAGYSAGVIAKLFAGKPIPPNVILPTEFSIAPESMSRSGSDLYRVPDPPLKPLIRTAEPRPLPSERQAVPGGCVLEPKSNRKPRLPPVSAELR